MSWTIEEFADVWGLLPTHRALQALWRCETITLPEKARLEAELAVLSARHERLRKAAARALEGMMDMFSYVPPYFQEKWGYQEYIDALRAALTEDGNG